MFAAAGLTRLRRSRLGGRRRDIAFWHLLSGGDGIKMQAMISAANGANPGFKVHPTVLAWGPPYYTKLAMASAGGRPPGGGHHARQPGPRLRAGRTHRSVGHVPAGRARRDGRRASLRRIWDKSQHDGKVFSIALDTHPFVMFYNTDVAGKAGVLGR